MTGPDDAPAPFSPRRLALLLAAGIGAAILGTALPAGPALEAWYLAVLTLAGLVFGALGLLILGHLMSEDWLAPVLSEAQAAARTSPLVALFALPLGLRLPELVPFGASLPGGRAAFLTEGALQARGAIYLAVVIGLAFWLTGTERPRRASKLALVFYVPCVTMAASDWILAREPAWWPALLGPAANAGQILAALAAAMLFSLLRPEHPSETRMQSVRAALVALLLLTMWSWFCLFLIVWLGNLPQEASWYLSRAGARLFLLSAAAFPAGAVAVAVLVVGGYGRVALIAGSGLVVVQQAAFMLWLTRPEGRGPLLTAWDAAVGLGLGLLAAAWFGTALRRRPTFRSELEPDPVGSRS